MSDRPGEEGGHAHPPLGVLHPEAAHDVHPQEDEDRDGHRGAQVWPYSLVSTSQMCLCPCIQCRWCVASKPIATDSTWLFH